MNKTGKIITIIIIAFVGLVALTLIKDASGGGMGFFGIFGLAIYLVYQNMFKKKESENNNEIKKVIEDDGEIKLKK